jgi:ABC-type oligopeptide transport system substrate-binding subunit
MVQLSHDLAKNLAEQWEETLGIRIVSCGVDYITYMDRVRAQDYDLSVICWVADYPDPETFLKAALVNNGSLAWSEEYSRMVTEAARLLDQKTRFELLARADRMLCEQAVVLPLFYNLSRAYMKPWIRREPRWFTGVGCWKDVIIDPH